LFDSQRDDCCSDVGRTDRHAEAAAPLISEMEDIFDLIMGGQETPRLVPRRRRASLSSPAAYNLTGRAGAIRSDGGGI
jgi:hypothetical protein